jgi:hypothetical protein
MTLSRLKLTQVSIQIHARRYSLCQHPLIPPPLPRSPTSDGPVARQHVSLKPRDPRRTARDIKTHTVQQICRRRSSQMFFRFNSPLLRRSRALSGAARRHAHPESHRRKGRMSPAASSRKKPAKVCLLSTILVPEPAQCRSRKFLADNPADLSESRDATQKGSGVACRQETETEYTACMAPPTRPQPASRWVLTCSFCATVVRPRCACEHATGKRPDSSSLPQLIERISDR